MIHIVLRLGFVRLEVGCGVQLRELGSLFEPRIIVEPKISQRRSVKSINRVLVLGTPHGGHGHDVGSNGVERI